MVCEHGGEEFGVTQELFGGEAERVERRGEGFLGGSEHRERAITRQSVYQPRSLNSRDQRRERPGLHRYLNQRPRPLHQLGFGWRLGVRGCRRSRLGCGDGIVGSVISARRYDQRGQHCCSDKPHENSGHRSSWSGSVTNKYGAGRRFGCRPGKSFRTVSRPSRYSATTPLVSMGTPVWRPTTYRPDDQDSAPRVMVSSPLWPAATPPTRLDTRRFQQRFQDVR